MMGKRASTKRVTSMSDAASASRAVDVKARKRIEELYELTDEIINAYNEVNETYVNKIYRKYKQLQNANKLLKRQLNCHHCSGCKCTIPSNEEVQYDEEEEDDEEDIATSSSDEDYEQRNKPSSSTTSKRPTTRRRTRQNPFLIPDIESTQHFDTNDSRLIQYNHDSDTEDRVSMTTNQNENKIPQADNKLGTEDSGAGNNSIDENLEEDEGMTRLPLTLQDIIRKKATKNKNAKSYLLQIPRYPALCEFLRDRSATSFDLRPSESQVRPLIANHLSQQMAGDSKIRMRLRDELREIHRSYMRTFMSDPHANSSKVSFRKIKRLNVKKSPM